MASTTSCSSRRSISCSRASGAIRDGLITEDSLRRRAAALRTRGRFGIPQLFDVLDGREITRGARASGRLVRVDCRFPGSLVVVELLGYRWHRSKAQMARDAERYNALLLRGLRPIQFTYDHVVDGPGNVVSVVRSALAMSA